MTTNALLLFLGYVSYQDFENQVRRLQVEGSKKDILSVAKLLDRDGDGFIDFKNFSQAFHATSQSLVRLPNE